jgi:hypothetical protein
VDRVIVFRRLDEGWEKEERDLFAEELLLDVPKNVFVEPLEVESLIRAVMRLSFMQQ